MPRQSEQLTVVIDGLVDVVEDVVQRLTLDITANLIETTPVDTGWARANWVPSIGAPYTLENPDNVVSGATSVQQQGILEVATYNLEQGNVHISNNVHYIEKLNDGHSNQAPRGFIQNAIEKAVDNLRF